LVLRNGNEELSKFEKKLVTLSSDDNSLLPVSEIKRLTSSRLGARLTFSVDASVISVHVTETPGFALIVFHGSFTVTGSERLADPVSG
jgi:hypothetical protein